MALYTVTQPCVVGGRHYTRPHETPVDVSAAEAKSLVAAGCLQPVAEPEHHRRGRHTDDTAEA